ncbi:MAG: alcohol dehydrogenase catalytic domain-containing protein, partial [bacterium]
MSDTMLAAALYGPGEVRIEEQPVPQPGPGEIVVRVEAALTCATDLKIFRNGRHPTLGPLPARIGHEMAGLVAKTGPGQTRFREGERVMVANSAPCDDCRACWRGQPSQCRNLMFLHGGFAQHLLVPRRIADLNVRPIPANLPYEHAALAEPLACALRGIEAAQIRPGATVVVIGGGALGLLLSRLAKRAGAQVILVGRRGDRLSLARNAYGIDETVDATLPDPAARVEALT